MTENSREAILQVRDLTVSFPTDDGEVKAVRGVSFDVHRGEILGIVGESGCGKTVSNLALMGLLPRASLVAGSVKINGEEIIGKYSTEMRRIRGKKISMIFQDPMTSLNPVYTVGWQLIEAVQSHQDISRSVARKKAIDLLEQVGIPNPSDRVDQYPHEFSGGMRQRVVIAMAIANEPDILICDEPTTALDVTVQAQILEMLLRIQRKTKTAIIFITHDLGVLAGIADRLLVMYAGKVVESGSIDDVFSQPTMPYTIGLLGAIPSEGSDGSRLNQIEGAPPSLINLPSGCFFAARCPIAESTCFLSEPSLRTFATNHLSACFKTDEILKMRDSRKIFFGVGETR